MIKKVYEKSVSEPITVPSPVSSQQRLFSPRVKPAVHYSRVVANILSGRPCDDPIPMRDVYSDNLGQTIFRNTLHGDREFKAYTFKKYGNGFKKKDIFPGTGNPSWDIYGASDADPFTFGGMKPPRREDCTANDKCWLPMYRRSYMEKLRSADGCALLARADFNRAYRLANECTQGKERIDGVCKSVTHLTELSPSHKKIYEWVKGPDGKPYKRLVGAYNELGTAISHSSDSIFGRPGKGGHRSKHNRYKGKGGAGATKSTSRGNLNYASRSDTRLGKKGASKSGHHHYSQQHHGHHKGNKHHGMNDHTAYRLDNMSIDGSGDSGPDDDPLNPHHRKNKHKRNKQQHAHYSASQEDHHSNDPRHPHNTRSSKKHGKSVHGQKAKENIMSKSYVEEEDKKPKKEETITVKNALFEDKRGGGKTKTVGVGGNRTGRNAGTSTGPGGKGVGTKSVGVGHNYSQKKSVGVGGKSGESKHWGGGTTTSKDHLASSSKHNLGKRGKAHGPHSSSRMGIQTRSAYDLMSRRRKRSSQDKQMYGTDSRYGGPDDNAGEGQQITSRPEDPELMAINYCWELASKVFKNPSKCLVIPPAENLMLYLETKYPRYKWGRGSPVASRCYPNGSTFVAQYANGGSRVYYPHGSLAMAISGPSPETSQILIIRDPSDRMFFFDKAILADLNSSGKGTIYRDSGIIKAQYSTVGGFKIEEGLEKGHRWQWNQGGQRMLLKLNKFISLRLSDFDKIFLNFYGNRRGFLANVATGFEVSLMNLDRPSDPGLTELKNLIRPKTRPNDHFDYERGRFFPKPTLLLIDKLKHYVLDTVNDFGDNKCCDTTNNDLCVDPPLPLCLSSRSEPCGGGPLCMYENVEMKKCYKKGRLLENNCFSNCMRECKSSRVNKLNV